MAAVCLRGVLDDFLDRMGPYMRPLGDLLAAPPACDPPFDHHVLLLPEPDALEALLDARYVQLCCPRLEQSRQALLVSEPPFWVPCTQVKSV